MRIALVASAGGHLALLLRLRPWFQDHERFWVVLDGPDARHHLAAEDAVFRPGPTNRRPLRALTELPTALRLLAERRPDVLVTNGAGLAVPYVLAARLRSIPAIFWEVPDRVGPASWTGRLVAPLCDEVVWSVPEQRAAYPRGRWLGPVL